MAYSVCKKIRDLTPYQPITGTYRIRLDANESFFPAPPHILSKIQEAAASVAYNRYPDPYAVELCRSFADFYQISPELVTAGNGSDELISLISSNFVMKGETVMTLSPDFSMYRFYNTLNESKCIEFHKNAENSVDVGALIAAVKEQNVRMLIFSNPCNPTGTGIKREEVRRLLRSVDALVVLDEAYMDFWDQSLLQEAGEFENLIILRTCSKAFGMAGIRLGFAVANPKLTNLLRAVKSPYNVNALTQAVGTIALREKDWARECLSQILASKVNLCENLKKMEQKYPGKFKVEDGVCNFVQIKTSKTEELHKYLLKNSIAVRCFPDCLRVTAGSPEENKDFLTAFENAISEII